MLKIQTHHDHVYRPTRTPRRRMGRGKKCFKASGQVFQASNTKSFLPASLHHSSLLLLRIIAINHIGTGWVVVEEQIPPKPPSLPKKKHTHVDIKKILSPSKLAVSILFSSSSCDLSNSLFLTKLKNRPKQSAEKNIQRLSKKSLDIKKEILVNLKTAIIE